MQKSLEMQHMDLLKEAVQLQFSPDGSCLAFLLQSVLLEKNKKCSDLWILNTADESLHQITEDGNCWSFFWYDTYTVGITEKTEETGKTRFTGIDIHSRERRDLFCAEISGASVRWYGNGKAVLTAAYYRKISETGDGAWILADELPYRFDEQGYINGRRTRLWIFDLRSGELRAVSDEYTETALVAVSESGRYIAYSGYRFEKLNWMRDGIWLYDAANNTVCELLPQDKVHVAGLVFDGDRVTACLTSAKDYGSEEWNPPKVVSFSVSGAQEELFTFSLDEDMLGLSNGRDGELIFRTIKGNFTVYRSWNSREGMKLLTDGFHASGIVRHEGQIYLWAEKTGLPGEIFRLAGGEWEQITHFNDSLISGIIHMVPQLIRFESKDKTIVDGFVTAPHGMIPGKKYPGILVIHGGPRAIAKESYNFTHQYLASRGYFVFICNPHGSAGRGEKFADLQGNLGYGTIDYDDFMAFTDAVQAAYPELDGGHIGLLGNSYGSISINLIIGRTERFAAAVSMNGLANNMGCMYVADIGMYAIPEKAGGAYYQDEAAIRKSPLLNAYKCVTPTLFAVGGHDYRCPMYENMQMYGALILNGCDTELLIVRDGTHGMLVRGMPADRAKLLRKIERWFEKYLKQH